MTGRAGGMLSMIDSQQLLTYDNLTAPGSFSDVSLQVLLGTRMSLA